MKDLIILQNDMDMLELLLYKYPKETDNNVLFHFVNDTRNVDKRKEIDKMIMNSKCSSIKNNYCIYDSKDIDTKAISKLNPLNIDAKLFFNYYRYNSQFTIPIYFSDKTDKIVMTDDDIVIYQDASLLFKYDNAFIRVPFNKYDKNNIPQQFYEYRNIFELDISVDEYNSDTLGAGTFTYTFEDRMIDYLNKFYANDFLMNIFKQHYYKYENGYKKDGYVSKSFFADQFWNWYFKKIIKDNNNKFTYENGEVRLILTKLKDTSKIQKKMLNAPVMIHYAAGSNKKLYIPILKQFNIVTKNNKKMLQRNETDNN